MKPKPILFTLNETEFLLALRGLTASNVRRDANIFNCRLTGKQLKIESNWGSSTVKAESPRSLSFQIKQREFIRANRAYKKRTVCEDIPCKIDKQNSTLRLPFTLHKIVIV
jgi:hypothetical protein